MRWRVSHRFDPVAKTLADRHYNRRNADSAQFVPPGRCLVLLSLCNRAFWVTSWPDPRFVKHAWPGAWVCSAFRNEGAGLSSELISDAVAATRWHRQRENSWQAWQEPSLGMITFVDSSKVRSVNPGCCYIKAGFKRCGYTKGGLVALQLLPADMPPPEMPVGGQSQLFCL